VFQRILIPVDLSPKNERAVAVAEEMARQLGSEVTLLHVIETIDLPFTELEDFYRPLEKRAADEMDALALPLIEAGIQVDRCVAYGARSREIVRHAAEKNIDLIVVSSHRFDPENPTQDWATVSHKVSILAHCPVLLVK
jgi:universal stress protein A